MKPYQLYLLDRTIKVVLIVAALKVIQIVADGLILWFRRGQF